MKPYLPAGKNAAGGGFIENYTYYVKLLRDDNQKINGLKKYFYYWNNTNIVYYWKVDDNLEQAQLAFKNSKFAEAKDLYLQAKEDNPNHIFIDNILEHLNYRKTRDSLKVLQQYELHQGNYGPRKFWVENGKFYYKRQDDEVNLPKVELLPLNDSLYMDMTRLGTLMSFTYENAKLISNSIGLDMESQKWDLIDKERNSFEKD
jgi:competence CoiA-like predicted nuclease